MEFPEVLEVQVLDKHIGNGNPKECTTCPIALAVAEMFPDNTVLVGSIVVSLFGKDFLEGKPTAQYWLDKEGSDFIEKFDNNYPVYPMAFKINKIDDDTFTRSYNEFVKVN